MKKYFLFIFTGLALFSIWSTVMAFENHSTTLSHQSACPPDSLLIAQLSSINLAYYQNKPVDSLLLHLPEGYATMKITGWRSIRVAEILHVVYPTDVVVNIHVRKFEHMNPNWVNTADPRENWNTVLFRKEKMTYAVIYNGTVCINGCENKYN